MLALMRVHDLNWMQLEAYLETDDRIVLPLGSTEQHAYLSLETDNILAERVAVEAAEPLGVPVLPVLPYGITPLFAAYPGSPSLRASTYLAVVSELLDSLYGQGFRRVLVVNGHGGNTPARQVASEWMADHDEAQAIFHDWWIGPRTAEVVREIEPAAHASWMESFPWTRLEGVELPAEPKEPLDLEAMRARGPLELRQYLGDGSFGGSYERPGEDILRVWEAGVAEVRALLESGWRS
jgi:creatinine amidohydrolase